MVTSIYELLQNAIDNAKKGNDSLLSYAFATPQGDVCFVAELLLEGEKIELSDVCIYAESDPASRL